MGTTTNNALPYPESSDYVTDGARAMQALAEAIDALLRPAAAGYVAAPSIAANTSTNFTVTYPAGIFTTGSNVRVTLTPTGNRPDFRQLGIITAAETSFVGIYYNTGNVTASTGVHWIAAQQQGAVATIALAAAGDVTTTDVTCDTPGCSNEGIPVAAITGFTDDGGNSVQVDVVLCGVCGQQCEVG